MASDTPSNGDAGAGPRIGLISLLLPILPLAAFGLAFVQDAPAAMRSYLWAFCVVAAVPLGSLALLALQHLTGGAWGVTLRRPLEAAVRTIPVIAIMFIPLALWADRLYPWANGEYEPTHFKKYYFDLTHWQGRAGLYFGLWMLFGYLFNRLSDRQDVANPPGFDRKFRLLAAPALAIYGLTITFASMDWVMSLEPHWFSSIYGVHFGVGQILSAFAFCVLTVLMLSDRRPLRGVIQSGHLRDYGSLLLAFVMIWMYLTISQFILIWSANLKEEAPYYVFRGRGIWGTVIGVVVFAQFFTPFLVLLTRDGKRNSRSLAFIAGLVLAARALELLWLVAPGRPIDGRTLFWSDLVALPALVLPWYGLFQYQLSRRPLLPLNVDPTPAEDHHG